MTFLEQEFFHSILIHVNRTLSYVDALFFKLMCLVWMLLCAISQSTYFAVSYSERLCFVLSGVKLSEECAKYCRKTALIYTTVAWMAFAMQIFLLLYSVFFTEGHLVILTAPIATYINLSDLLIPRVVMFLFLIYLNAAWVFPHAMGFMLAQIFTCEYKHLGQAFDETLHKCDERRVSDSDIEMFRQKHQDISMHLSEADGFLMFHNAGAFCCQLGILILLLYALIFFRMCPKDPIVLTMYIFWLFFISSGLSLTTAGGIMVNHYVSTNLMWRLEKATCINCLRGGFCVE